MTTISSNPALKQRLEEKFEKIKHDICKPWSEKISKALFTFSKKQKELEDIYKQVNDATSKERNDEETEGISTTVAATSATTSAASSTAAPAPSTNEQKPAEETPQSPVSAESSPSENTEPAIQPLAPESEPVEPKPTEETIERIISVEVDWASFNDLFDSLYREGAGEVIDTIIESLISKDCAISLLSSLLEHCRPPGGESYKVSKHEQIRAFLQQGLKKYVIKYSDDPREWGFFKDGTLCDVVEIDVTDDEEINWIFRDVTKNIEKSTHLQQFIVSKYLIPQFRLKIYNVLYAHVALDIDWISIDYAAADYAKAVYTIYHDSSLFVLDEVYRAFEWIAMYEPDELVDAIVHGIKRVVIALQPGHDYTRKDFDINDKTKTLTLRLCLEADEFAGVFRSKDLIPIIKVAGLYANKFTSLFKFELLSAAAAIYKLPRGDLGLFQNILNRKELWASLNEKETKALDICKKFIDKYYKERMGHEAERAEGEDEDEDEEYEKIIKGWHVIKFNKRNLHQERYLVLTNRAYWTFKCEKGKVDSKHFKRHDLLDFYLAELGTLEETAEAAIFALKMYTREKRKGSIIPFGEEKREGGKTVVSTELRKSLRLKPSTSNDLNTLKQQLAGLDFDSVKPARVKKQKPPREKPNVDGCYNSVIIPHVKEGQELDPIEIKNFLTEIALCFFAAASARQRNKITEPVLDAGALLVPKGNWMSFLHNVVGLGMNRKFNFRLGSNKKTEKPEKAVKAEAKPKKAEAATTTKPGDVVIHTPNGSKKAAKPILKIPSVPAEELSVSKPEEKEGAEINVTVCSHNRRVVFRPEVQVFYHETDEGADEGGEDD